MTAPLGKVLVLELDCVGAGLLEPADCAHHIEGVAVAGVCVDDEMGVDTIADQGHRVGDLAHADETDIGPPEPRVGDGCAGDVERGESGLSADQCGERIIDAGRHHDGFPGQARTQGFRLGHGHIPR